MSLIKKVQFNNNHPQQHIFESNDEMLEETLHLFNVNKLKEMLEALYNFDYDILSRVFDTLDQSWSLFNRREYEAVYVRKRKYNLMKTTTNFKKSETVFKYIENQLKTNKNDKIYVKILLKSFKKKKVIKMLAALDEQEQYHLLEIARNSNTILKDIENKLVEIYDRKNCNSFHKEEMKEEDKTMTKLIMSKLKKELATRTSISLLLDIVNELVKIYDQKNFNSEEIIIHYWLSDLKSKLDEEI